MRGERVCYFGFGGSEERALQDLRSSDLDLDELISSERLMIGDAIDAYMPDGNFDGDERIAGFRDLAQRSLADGFAGIRVAAETAWLLEVNEAREAWPTYEVRVELLTSLLPITGMCTFDARGMDAATVAMLAAVHRETVGVPAGSSTFQIHAAGPGVLSIGGVLVGDGADLLDTAITAGGSDLSGSTLDLSRLEYVDTRGLRAVLKLVDAIEARGEVPVLQGVSPLFRRLWTSLDLEPRRRAILV